MSLKKQLKIERKKSISKHKKRIINTEDYFPLYFIKNIQIKRNIYFYKKFERKIESNDIKEVEILLKKINPSFNCNSSIIKASCNGYIEIIKLLLNDPRVDPSDFNNRASILADANKYPEVVKLLWKDKRVKDSLKKDNEYLYNKLIQKDIKNKIKNF